MNERFRYPQICPVARAAELLGQRWTLLALRELMLGPQRFSDLRRRLAGVSPSVLAERLTGLEEAGVVRRRELPPPGAAQVYELTELGEASRPVLVELMRWGMRLMTPPEPGDQLEPDWLRLAAAALVRRDPSPPRRLRLRVEDANPPYSLGFAGGPEGTRRLDDDEPVDATLHGAALTFLAAASGVLDPAEAVRQGQLRVEGELQAALDLPLLFDADVDASASAPPQTKGHAK